MAGVQFVHSIENADYQPPLPLQASMQLIKSRLPIVGGRAMEDPSDAEDSSSSTSDSYGAEVESLKPTSFGDLCMLSKTMWSISFKIGFRPPS